MSELLDRISKLPPEKRQQLLDKIKDKTTRKPLPNRTISPLQRDSHTHEFPLSFSQQRLWFMYQWEPDSPSYNIPCVFRIPVELNIALLEQSLNVLVERHEILRTTYKMVQEEETVQVIHPFSPLSLQVFDLSSLSEKDKKRQMETLIKQKSMIPFKLENELPIKAHLLTLNSQEHYLFLNIHHIACDGWSLGIIMSEIQQSYKALRHNLPLELPPISIQYADYAAWQRSFMVDEVLNYHQSYWFDKFQGELPVLELPVDKPRPPVKSSNGSHIIQPLSEGFYHRLQQWCKEEDVTVYMMTLTAYAILLYRYTGQTDIIIGSPVANRSREEIERNVGFFVNTLPIRVHLSETSTFREMVKQIKHIALEAQEHQDFPLDKLIELLPMERDLSHSPLFQVMFILQNMHVGWNDDSEEFPLQFDSSTHTNSSKFDMTFSVNAHNVEVEYSTDLFHEATMKRMLGHYFNLLDHACSDPDQVIAGINLMSVEEKQHLLVEGNKTDADYDSEFHLVQRIEAEADKSPHHPALIFEGVTYTYGDMNKCANRLAHYLLSQGIGPEQVVGIFIERSAEYVIAMLAVLKAGGAYVPLDPSYPKERLTYMIKQSGMQILLTQSKLSGDIQFEQIDVAVVEVDQANQRLLLEQLSDDNPVLHTESANLMYIVFTSGTTGTPKGVAVELQQFHNYIQGLIKHLSIQEPLSYAMASTFAADLGTTNVFGALCTGGTLHVLSYDLSCDPDGVAEYFRTNRIDVMKVVPSHFEVMMEAAQPELVIPHKILILAGEGLSWETVRKINRLRPDVMIENHYGPTETTVSAFAYPIKGDLHAHPFNTVPIGYPFGNVQLYILDTYLQPIPIGVPGELFIGGAGVARGYFGNQELTDTRFVLNPFVEDEGARLYRTGDRVRYMPNGAVEILGRMDRQIKIRGFRIELGEIESVITSFPFVTDAVVLLKDVGNQEKKIVAYAVFDLAEQVGNPQVGLRKKLKDKLPEYMIPTHIIPMDSLPLNPNGKVDISLLAAMEIAVKVADPNGAQPQTATEIRIWEVWKVILGVEMIGVDDNFFELGGDSFKALKVVRRLGDWISIMDFFKQPTIRSLAEYIDQGKASDHHLLHKLTTHPAQTAADMSLVCIPYAGGSAITYQPLAAQMPSHIDLYAIDLPGHDYSRKDEALLPIEEVAYLCVEQIKQMIKGPVALYGHCVGGALTIEIARQLDNENYPLKSVFLGGTFPIARIPGRFFDFYSKLFPSDRSMSNKSYHAFLKALGGFTEVEDQDERDFMIRCLRHDARESENYYTSAYADHQLTKLSCPITCIIGEKDKATELYEERYKEWEYFSEQIDLVVIPQSGHYFIKHQADQLSGWISDIVKVKDNLANGIEELTPPQKRVAVPNLRMFFTVILGQLMSILGSGLTGIAIGVWVFSQTGSVADFAAISSASLIPGILILPIAGAIVDRYNRRLVMLFSDVMMAIPIIVLAILMATNSLEVWHIYVTSAVGSIARSFHRPAFMAAIAQIIPKQYLGHANGLVQLATSTSEMIAPLIGVALYTMIGMTNIFILDFFSFLIAITTLAIVRFPNTLFHRRVESFAKEVLMGWKFIIRRPGMLYMIAFFFVGNVLFGLATVLVQPLILSFGSARDLATVTMTGSIGAMVGGLLMSIWGGTKRMATGMVGFVILEGLSMIVAGLRPDVFVTAVGIFGIWFSVTLVNTHWQSLIQSKVGLELQGRVLATNQMIAMSSMPIGYLIAGLLADSVFGTAMNQGGVLANTLGPILGVGPGRGIGVLIICVGVLVMIWSIIGFNFKPLRHMEDHLDDAVPDAIMGDIDSLQERLDNHVKEKVNSSSNNNTLNV
ncbi:amino acid adenylation domain-containing protein [Paenibacillus anaericanus]|uniref:Amino acid adenylation domain-containing protein n=1 Tax=Paenibacillus anaericanus TaxID=170367 RepID=A0A3S1DSP7_9BACL|nr:non-ribosomal peptide synthetase/MFS transporter [Paenibacillus anaericanus]RUT44539.1 amino acid adenylation domain-containing protein [Paenibacillus anaericanus]